MFDINMRYYISDSHWQFRDQYQSNDTRQKSEGPASQKGFDAITSSISYIGNAVEVSFCQIFFIPLYTLATTSCIGNAFHL